MKNKKKYMFLRGIQKKLKSKEETKMFPRIEALLQCVSLFQFSSRDKMIMW